MKKKLLPPQIISFVRRSYSTDRSYSTALGVLPDYDVEVVPEGVDDVACDVKPYSAIPGPRELPIIGNAWRFAPIIGELFWWGISRWRVLLGKGRFLQIRVFGIMFFNIIVIKLVTFSVALYEKFLLIW